MPIVTTYVGTPRVQIGTAIEDLHQKLETIAGGSTIRIMGIDNEPEGRRYTAYIIYDT